MKLMHLVDPSTVSEDGRTVCGLRTTASRSTTTEPEEVTCKGCMGVADDVYVHLELTSGDRYVETWCGIFVKMRPKKGSGAKPEFEYVAKTRIVKASNVATCRQCLKKAGFAGELEKTRVNPVETRDGREVYDVKDLGKVMPIGFV